MMRYFVFNQRSFALLFRRIFLISSGASSFPSPMPIVGQYKIMGKDQ